MSLDFGSGRFPWAASRPVDIPPVALEGLRDILGLSSLEIIRSNDPATLYRRELVAHVPDFIPSQRLVVLPLDRDDPRPRVMQLQRLVIEEREARHWSAIDL